MAIIFQKTPGQLIAQPGRAVSTFQTGLVRIDQTYICASQDAARHRASMSEGAPMPDGNTSPCIDGVFISPIPGEVDRGDGFTEFRVSGYGRSKSKPSDVKITTKELSTSEQANFAGYVDYMVFEASGTAIVIDDDEFSYQDLGLPVDFLAPFNMKYLGDGEGWSFKKMELGSAQSALQYEDLTGQLPDGRTVTTRVYRGAVPSRGYNVTFQKAGSPDKVINVPIQDPVLKIISRSPFGKYSEVTFSYKRNKSEGI